MAKVKHDTWSKAPFPYFGGKRDAAEVVWSALGDCVHYVEPFAGSLAVLLRRRRPHLANRQYYTETVNDLDFWLVNFWRALQADPDGVAEAASWPVSEADLFARHLWLVRWSRSEATRNAMLADPDWHDVKAAGWWVWGISAWIGTGWCAGTGPWTEVDGQVVKQPRQKRGDAREPGVASQLPHLGGDGQGVHTVTLREPGVDSKLPHLGDDGKGVHTMTLREPGVDSKLPHLGGDGKGVLREPGLGEPHPMTMPKLREWLRFLAARLRHVRILHGDWTRALTGAASKTLSVRKKGGVCGVFLDPPYSDAANRAAGLYGCDSLDVAHAVREWCAENGDDPKYRIVLAGFDSEHGDLEAKGWRAVEWYKSGFLKGGYGNQNKASGTQMHRDRLWLSPHCLAEEQPAAPEKERDDDVPTLWREGA